MLGKYRKKEPTAPTAAAENQGAAPEQPTPAPADPLAEAQLALANAQAEAAKNWDLYLRERAELENFRKRTQRDRRSSASSTARNCCSKCCRCSTTWSGPSSMPAKAAKGRDWWRG